MTSRGHLQPPLFYNSVIFFWRGDHLVEAIQGYVVLQFNQNALQLPSSVSLYSSHFPCCHVACLFILVK